MNLILLISNHCDACLRAIKKLQNFQEDNPQVISHIMHISEYPDKRIFITPALIVNGELLAYGDFDYEKLISKLK